MPLNDPVPSTAADVLERNVQDFDRFVVGAENTFVNRLGVEKLTMAGINDAALTGNPAVQAAQQAIDAKNEAQLYAEAAATNADWIYPNVAAGEAERVDGDYFWVVSADDNEVLELWMMGAATATDTGKRTASNDALKGFAQQSDVDKLDSTVKLNSILREEPAFSHAFNYANFKMGIYASFGSQIDEGSSFKIVRPSAGYFRRDGGIVKVGVNTPRILEGVGLLVESSVENMSPELDDVEWIKTGLGATGFQAVGGGVFRVRAGTFTDGLAGVYLDDIFEGDGPRCFSIDVKPDSKSRILLTFGYRSDPTSKGAAIFEVSGAGHIITTNHGDERTRSEIVKLDDGWFQISIKNLDDSQGLPSNKRAGIFIVKDDASEVTEASCNWSGTAAEENAIFIRNPFVSFRSLLPEIIEEMTTQSSESMIFNTDGLKGGSATFLIKGYLTYENRKRFDEAMFVEMEDSLFSIHLRTNPVPGDVEKVGEPRARLSTPSDGNFGTPSLNPETYQIYKPGYRVPFSIAAGFDGSTIRISSDGGKVFSAPTSAQVGDFASKICNVLKTPFGDSSGIVSIIAAWNYLLTDSELMRLSSVGNAPVPYIWVGGVN